MLIFSRNTYILVHLEHTFGVYAIKMQLKIN